MWKKMRPCGRSDEDDIKDEEVRGMAVLQG